MFKNIKNIAILLFVSTLVSTTIAGVAFAADASLKAGVYSDDTDVYVYYTGLDLNLPPDDESPSLGYAVTNWSDLTNEDKEPNTEWLNNHVKQFDGWNFYNWSVHEIDENSICVNYYYYPNEDGENSVVKEKLEEKVFYDENEDNSSEYLIEFSNASKNVVTQQEINSEDQVNKQSSEDNMSYKSKYSEEVDEQATSGINAEEDNNNNVSLHKRGEQLIPIAITIFGVVVFIAVGTFVVKKRNGNK